MFSRRTYNTKDSSQVFNIAKLGVKDFQWRRCVLCSHYRNRDTECI